jgi:polysaccharide export outer membrane protein
MRRSRVLVTSALAVLALPGCMQSATVALAQPQNSLDALAYGPPPSSPVQQNSNSGGGAIAALRSSLASARRPALPRSTSEAYAAVPAPSRFKSPAVSGFDASYKLDTGDRLRIVVYGQEGLTNIYAIDASGAIAMPLIGAVTARGRTAAALATEITGRLRNGYIREPSVAVELDAYRPFFILGEVAAPGQYPYVPNMTVESAVAIAGGFAPRAKRDAVGLTHVTIDGAVRTVVPLGTLIDPGDTVQVGERWF